MKQLFNLSKSRYLLLMLFALLTGVSPAWAETETICDDTSTNSYVPFYGNYADETQQNQMIYPSEKLTNLVGKQLTQMVFYLKTIGSYGSGVGDWIVSMGTTEATTLTALDTQTSLTQVFSGTITHNATEKTITITFATPFLYTGNNLLIEFNHPTASSYKDYSFYGETAATGSAYTYKAQRSFLPKCTFTYETPASGPALAVKDGSTKLTSPYAYNFGLAEAGATKTFTLSNPGTESITVNIAATGGFGVSPTNVTIDAKGETTLTVTMADETATGDVTITPTAEGVDAFTINVSGTIKDPNKFFESLLVSSMPNDWSTSGGTWSWSTTNGASNTAWYESSNYRLITPQLTVAEGEQFFFDAQGTYSGYQGVIFEYSADGTNWTASSTTTTVSADWQTFAISDIPAGTYYIALHGWHVNVRNFYGGQLYVPTGAKFAIDPAGTSQNLGLTAVGGNLEKTFTVTNAGNEALTVTFTAPTGFDVVGKATTFILTDNLGWNTAKVYAWDANQNPLNGAWPGTVDAEIVYNDYDEKQFKVVVPNGAVGVIVNNGNGAQTENITNFNSFEGFWMDGSTDADGHYKVEGWGTYSNPAIADLTVAAGESKPFTVKMNTDVTGAMSGTLSLALSNNVLDATSPYEIQFSGVVMPEGANVVDFNDNQLPENWTSTGTWSFENGEAGAKTAATMTTPAVEVSEADFLVLKVRNYGSWNDDYVQVEAYNGTEWSVVKKIMSTEFYSSTEYTSLVVTGIPTTTTKLRFTAYYAYIDEIVGINYAAEPILKMTSDAEGNTELAANTTCDLGWVTADASYTYYIKNAGTATLNISEITAPAGITATTAGNVTTVDPATTLALTISMAAENNFGAHTGTVTITTDGGNYEMPVSGVVRNADKLYLDFSADGTTFPAGWSTGNWNITSGTAVASGNLQTTKLKAAAGEQMVIEAISNGSYYNTASLSYSYSTDNGESWTAATSVVSQLNTDAYSIITLDAVDATDETDVLVKFTGSNVSVRRIYGFTEAPVAIMTTTAANMAFGMLTAESEEQTFTITNDANAGAELTGLSLTLGKTGDDAQYSLRMTDSEDAAFTGTTLAIGQTITVHVKQLFDINHLGAKSDVLTIAADDQTTVTINLTGSTRDGSLLYVDFDSPNAFPDGWQAGADWNVSTTGTDRYAYQGSSKTPSALVTTPLTVEEGQVLSFKVSRNSSGYGYTTSMKLRYSQDGGVNWSPYVDYNENNDIDSGWKTIEPDNLPTGNLLVEFFGNNIKLDMIQGLKLATAPALALTEDGAAVENGSTKDFGNLSADGVATYTLKNTGNDVLKSTITGDGVSVTPASVTLAAGETAEITVTMTYAAPYGTKSGSMTIVSEGWVGDMTVNYTAETISQDDFVEDFAGNAKPAGWYSESWTYSDGNAHVYAGVAKPMITEKIGAESGRNVLTFDAKVYSGEDEQTLNVYTSADRLVWSEAQSFTLTSTAQNFSLEALADGEYYVKFEASNASVDNIKGVKRLAAPEHDLMVTGVTGLKLDYTPGEAVSATVSLTSLRANETGVYAKVFCGTTPVLAAMTEWVSSTTYDVALNGTTNITMTGNAPTEEGNYYAAAIVYYGDGSIAFQTATAFKVEHTTSLAVNGFEAATPSVTADDNHQYTATFNVTVQNTGSKSLTAEEVSVSVIDAEDNAFTTSWTTESSNVLYMNTAKDGTDIATDCTLKAWCWSTAEDGVWIAFTNVNEGFWSLDLDGRTNFKVCRFNPNGTATDPWDNVWNQSDDLSLADGNLIKFTGYNGNDMNFTSESMAYLEPTMTTTLKVTVTGTASASANYAFRAKENVSNTYYGNGLTRSVDVTVVGSVTAKIGSTGYTTFAGNYSLDLDNLEDGLTAYYVTVDGVEASKVKLTKATGKVKLGTGLILKGTASQTYNIPTAVGTEAVELSGNLMVGCTTETTLDVNPNYYVLVKNDEGEPEFQDLSEYGATIPAGKAYLDATSVAAAGARLAIVIDETTGIAGFSADASADDVVYNLNGQRMQRVKKGLNIVNGRVVVIK